MWEGVRGLRIGVKARTKAGRAGAHWGTLNSCGLTSQALVRDVQAG